MTFLKKINLNVFFFLGAVAFFSLVFYLERHFMTNFDENDHLAADFFIKNGRLLYRDFFSHHFPLPYYWSALFTPFWSTALPARTIAFFRFSVLSMYLLNFVLVFFAFKSSLSRFSYSLWIILLSFFFSLYHGNLVLSETFAAIFISSIFWLTTPVLLKWEKVSTYSLILLVLFSSAAFWTQPLLIELSLIPLFLAKNHRFRWFLFIFAFNLIPILIFLVTGQLAQFWQQGIIFNFFVYPKFYVDTVPFDNKTFGPILYFFQNEFYFFTHFGNAVQIFQFLVHFSLLVLIFSLLKTKKLILALPLLILFFAARVREVKIIPGSIFNFGIYPFLLIASSALILLLMIYFHRRLFVLIPVYLAILIIAFLSSRPIILQSLHSGYNYEVFWSYRQRNAEIMDKLSLSSEKILIYPHDVDYYALASRFPPDHFLYWFPWIDSVASYRQARLTALKTVDIPVIYVGNLDFKGQKDYYAQYFPDLLKNYQPILKDNKPTGIWLSKNHLDRLKSL